MTKDEARLLVLLERMCTPGRYSYERCEYKKLQTKEEKREFIKKMIRNEEMLKEARRILKDSGE